LLVRFTTALLRFAFATNSSPASVAAVLALAAPAWVSSQAATAAVVCSVKPLAAIRGDWALRFSANSAGSFQPAAERLSASRPRRLDSGSSTKALGVFLDRPTRAPLMRFFPLQRLLTALRCPRGPPAGRSRFGFGWFFAAPPKCFTRAVFRTKGEASQPAHAVFRSHLHAGHRRMPDREVGSPRVMHRGPLIPRCSATRFGYEPYAAPPGRSRPGDAHGVLPFAGLLLHAGFAGVSAVFPHMPLGGPPPRSFSSRDRPSDIVARTGPALRRRSRSPTFQTEEKRPITEAHFGFWV